MDEDGMDEGEAAAFAAGWDAAASHAGNPHAPCLLPPSWQQLDAYLRGYQAARELADDGGET